MIIIDKLKKKYGSKVALNGVSLEVKKGEFVSVLGPNGAGKTTMIRCTLALMFPDGGSVEILGKNPFKDKSVFREIGYVQELPNLPPFLTGRQVLKLSAKMKGASKDEVDELLELVGMKEFADRQIAKYSKGMTQRIAIAEALLNEPQVLIMDEPNIGVDPIFSLHIRETFDKLKKKETSILMTSHEMEDVKKLSDKVVLIYRGNKVFEGNVEELVKKFLGIVVVIEADQRAEEVLKGFDFVKKVESDGSGKYYVTLSEDKREELLRELVFQGVKVRSFYLDVDIEKAYERAINNV
jgi:ABC-2 type transport system ATP-binding protein